MKSKITTSKVAGNGTPGRQNETCHSLFLWAFALLCSFLLPGMAPAQETVNLTVYYDGGSGWQQLDALTFGNFPAKRTLELPPSATRVKLAPDGVHKTHLDLLTLNRKPPTGDDTGNEYALRKLAAQDHDVLELDGERIFEFAPGGGQLDLTARVEVRPPNPRYAFKYPVANLYNEVTAASEFYTYATGSRPGAFDMGDRPVVPGRAFLAESVFETPGTGHAPGYNNLYVADDGEALYFFAEFTADNTFDHGDDYFAVHILDGSQVKTFRKTTSPDDRAWGRDYFDYTPTVGYQHMSYVIRIPFAELGEAFAADPASVRWAAELYGTSTFYGVSAPELEKWFSATDPYNTGYYAAGLRAARDGNTVTITTADGAPVTLSRGVYIEPGLGVRVLWNASINLTVTDASDFGSYPYADYGGSGSTGSDFSWGNNRFGALSSYGFGVIDIAPGVGINVVNQRTDAAKVYGMTIENDTYYGDEMQIEGNISVTGPNATALNIRYNNSGIIHIRGKLSAPSGDALYTLLYYNNYPVVIENGAEIVGNINRSSYYNYATVFLSGGATVSSGTISGPVVHFPDPSTVNVSALTFGSSADGLSFENSPSTSTYYNPRLFWGVLDGQLAVGIENSKEPGEVRLVPIGPLPSGTPIPDLTVTLDLNGGSGIPTTVQVPFGSEYYPWPEPTTSAAYTWLTGWQVTTPSTNTTWSPGYRVVQNLTLQALWDSNSGTAPTVENSHNLYAGTVACGSETVHYLRVSSFNTNPSRHSIYDIVESMRHDFGTDYSALLPGNEYFYSDYAAFDMGNGREILLPVEIAAINWANPEDVAAYFFPGITVTQTQEASLVKASVPADGWAYHSVTPGSGYTTYGYLWNKWISVSGNYLLQSTVDKYDAYVYHMTGTTGSPSLPPLVATATTAKAAGTTFTFDIGALADNTDIWIDWGDGVPALQVTKAGTTVQQFAGTLAGSDVKVYGTGISQLEFYQCELTDVDVTQATDLTYFSCFVNQLTSLDVSQNVNLTELNCGVNRLTALDVSANTVLATLSCQINRLTALDISSNTSLTSLYCDDNELDALNISSSPLLNTLYCSNNALKFSTLPLAIPVTGTYAPQDTIRAGLLPFASQADLSSEAVINGANTVYTWYDISTTPGTETPVAAGLVTGDGAGRFTFDTSLTGTTLRCKMTNATFPALTLVYEATPAAPVNAQTPTISAHPQPASYTAGATALPLTVTASVTDGGMLTYQWYSNTVNSNTGGAAIPGATGNAYTPSTNATGTTYYYVIVTNTNNSVTGAKIATATSNVATVTVTVPPAPVNAQTPIISAHPQPASYTVRATALPLTVTASVTDGGMLTYQWYNNTVNSNTGGAAIPGATGNAYTPSTITTGTVYYYVTVTNNNAGATGLPSATATSAAAAVTVTDPVIPPPRYSVTLTVSPYFDSNPSAGVIIVEGARNLLITLTPRAALPEGYVPQVTTNRTSLPDDNGGVTVTPNSDGTYTVRIAQILQNITVTVAAVSPVTNEDIPVTRVWSYGNRLYVATASTGQAYVYHVSGVPVKILTLAAGETSVTTLPQGIYLVVTGGKTFKVVVSE